MPASLPATTLIVIPFFQPWDRPADFQRQTCLRLAKKYQVIGILEYAGEFWLKAVLKALWEKIMRQRGQWNRQKISTSPASSSTSPTPLLPPKLQLVRPLYFFPGQRWSIIRQLNQKIWLLWLTWRWRQLSPKWLWLFDPEAWAYPTGIPDWKSLYDCVDDHSQIDAATTQRLEHQEHTLITTATLFTTNSQTLAQLHQTVRQPDAVVVQGFDLALKPSESFKLTQKKTSSKPILSLLGGLDERIDWELLTWLAQRLPNCEFILAGPISPEVKPLAQRCLNLPNVTYQGYLPRLDLAEIYAKTTIGLIPYDIHQATVLHAFPMKLLEYFAFGKPVVASPISELQYYSPYVSTAQTRKQWLATIQHLLKKPWSKATQNQAKNIALTHSYENKLTQITKLMGKYYSRLKPIRKMRTQLPKHSPAHQAYYYRYHSIR